MDEQQLQYSIHSWSSFSPSYHPMNILNDEPSNQASRWSSDTNYPPQFICMRLTAGPSIVTSITFGKFEKTHVCNLKKFTVLGGVTEDRMADLLVDGLKNDSAKETFELNHSIDGNLFPCTFIKIVPIMSWGPTFNFSIWHIALTGSSQQEIVRPALKWFNLYHEQKVLRLCLKHFRQRNYMDVFDRLESRVSSHFEHPMLAQLHRFLVRECNFVEAESVIEAAAQEGLFDEYVQSQTYVAKWKSIIPLNENGVECSLQQQPGMRGGHQMCMDAEGCTIYLLGGWDGARDLSDFWMYSTQQDRWHCLSTDTQAEGGPSARSCHKMSLDSNRRHLYVLGRYLDNEARMKSQLVSELFKYEVDSGSWSLVCPDTNAVGGPKLVFDHQMVFDAVSDSLFVFGGRILTSSATDELASSEPLFSGLFSYHIPTQKWHKIRDDETQGCKSRIGHSMLFDQTKRLLYIFAGQRGRENLSDFFSYHIETGEITHMIGNLDNEHAPSSGFTQRSTIDTELAEIYVLSGLSKDKERREDTIRNSFWVFHLPSAKWSCVYRNENQGQQYWTKMVNLEPCPRFAHQLVYDQLNKIHYLFGGNPGRSSASVKVRLDDFWKLKLERLSVADVKRKCKYLIRTLRYTELTRYCAVEALPYLQNEVSQLVDHTNQVERDEFESLASALFTQHDSQLSDDEEEGDGDYHRQPSRNFKARSEVFDVLSSFFPKQLSQPTDNLLDLVTLS